MRAAVLRFHQPHPEVHLREPASVASVALRIGRGMAKTQIVLDAVCNRGATVSCDEARNERGAVPSTLASGQM